MKLHRILSAVIVAVAVGLILVMATGCKETGSQELGTVQEVRPGNDCEIRVAPVSDHRGSYGRWVTVPESECGKYKPLDKYPKRFP
jgi:hypothetical protein